MAEPTRSGESSQERQSAGSWTIDEETSGNFEINITEIEKRSSDYIREPYIVYLIETRCLEKTPRGMDEQNAIWRRYSEFELLRNYLVAVYPYIIVPPLPEKRLNMAAFRIAVDRMDPEFIEKRKAGLEHFLRRCAKHTGLRQDMMYLTFLSLVEGWKDSILSTQFQTKVDGRLKSLNAAMSLKKPDRDFEDMRHYADSFGTNISGLLKVRQSRAEKIYNIFKSHSGYGKVFSEWSVMEQEMGDSLQKVGHYMDSMAAGIDNLLDEEESTYAGSLKEYQFYAEAIKTVTRKQQLRQYDLEKAEENLAAKGVQREDLLAQRQSEQDGTTVSTKPSSALSFKGFSSMIFGAETSETRDAKISTLETQIEEAEKTVKSSQEEIQVFKEKALEEYELFKIQKNKDLHRILVQHVKNQIRLCKLGLSSWENIKETFKTM